MHFFSLFFLYFLLLKILFGTRTNTEMGQRIFLPEFIKRKEELFLLTFNDISENLNHLLKFLNIEIFISTVVIITSGSKVWSDEPIS